MKRFFVALGKGISFAALYIALQFIVTMIATVIFSVSGAFGMAAQGLDTAALTAEVTEKVLSGTNLLSAISNVLTLLTIWLIFGATKRRYFEEIRLFKTPVKALWPIPVAAIGMTLVISSALELIPVPETAMESYMESVGALSAGNPIVAFIAVVIIAPIAEETVFRGLVYTRFRQGMPIIVAIILECAVFGVLHGNLIWIIYAFVLGVVMTLVFEAYDTLIASLIFHVTFNLFGSYIVPVIDFRNMYVPLIAGLLITVISALFIVRWRGRRRIVDRNQDRDQQE